MTKQHQLVQIEDYIPLVGAESIERIREKARPLHGMHVVHISSTYYGGGVAEILSSLALLMNSVGIKKDGVNGFLVSSIRETADRIVQLIKDRDLRMQMGREAREVVRRRFLMVRLLEQYLDLFNSFETVYRLKGTSGAR